MSGTASRAKKRSNSNVLQYPTYILKDICQTKNKGLHYTTPGFLSKMAQKRQKTALFRQKTPDIFEINIRTFEAKHRNFAPKKSDVSAFPARKRRENTQNGASKPIGPILRYFGPTMGVVASDGLLGPITAHL